MDTMGSGAPRGVGAARPWGQHADPERLAMRDVDRGEVGRQATGRPLARATCRRSGCVCGPGSPAVGARWAMLWAGDGFPAGRADNTCDAGADAVLGSTRAPDEP